MSTRVLRALQGGLEKLYRVETELDVCDFLVGENQLQRLRRPLPSSGPQGFTTERSPREQLLIRQTNGEMELGLFVDERTLENLAARDPAHRLDDDNLQDFLYAVEGVSHFVYLVHRAKLERPVSAVELELQAEVDKYLVALLVILDQLGEPPGGLRERLFSRIRFHGDLSPAERERYQLANSAAETYAASLEERFVSVRAVDRRIAEMLAEARIFYRKGLADKLAHITQLAA